MTDRQSQLQRVLATDLDGTLIPLADNEQNRRDLVRLQDALNANDVEIVFVTGRHLEAVLEAADEQQLPLPDWIICDVGTSIYKRETSADTWNFAHVKDYQDHQREIIAPLPMDKLRELLEPVSGLRLQEEEKQGPYKLSFYADANRLEELVGEIQKLFDRASAPYSMIHSVDPFNGDGLIDLLPRDVSKAHALSWWVEHVGLHDDNIVFAGDSGNDLAALSAGYRAIVVGNADRSVAQQAQEAHASAGFRDRLYLAQAPATSGVLEGCRWYGLFNKGDGISG